MSWQIEDPSEFKKSTLAGAIAAVVDELDGDDDEDRISELVYSAIDQHFTYAADQLAAILYYGDVGEFFAQEEISGSLYNDIYSGVKAALEDMEYEEE